MEKNLVIGASGGIGGSICHTLTGEVIKLSRSVDGFDVTDPDSVDALLDNLNDRFNRIWVTIGILGTPEKSLSAITAHEMTRVLAVNTIGVALILRHIPRLLSSNGRLGVLSARVGSIGDNRLGGWHSYRASKAAVNQLIHGAAIELSRTHKESVVAALHPGTVETSFTAGYTAKKLTPDESASKLISVLDNLTPAQTGGFYDFEGVKVPW